MADKQKKIKRKAAPYMQKSNFTIPQGRLQENF